MSQRVNLRVSIAISLGAIAGALSRYYGGQWFAHTFAHPFPLGTLLVNVSGSCFMGWIATVVVNWRSLPPDVILLLTTGFLGSYTTFSTYELETAQLIKMQMPWQALLYWVGSPLLGILGCLGGVQLAQAMRSLMPQK